MTLITLSREYAEYQSSKSRASMDSSRGGVPERYSLWLFSLLAAIDTRNALKSLWVKNFFLIRKDKIFSFSQLYFFPEDFNSCKLLLFPK